MTESLISNPSVHTELVATGCGLHANSKNPEFHPGAEAVAKWAALTLKAADEIERLRRYLTAIDQDYVSAEAMRKCAQRALRPEDKGLTADETKP